MLFLLLNYVVFSALWKIDRYYCYYHYYYYYYYYYYYTYCHICNLVVDFVITKPYLKIRGSIYHSTGKWLESSFSKWRLAVILDL